MRTLHDGLGVVPRDRMSVGLYGPMPPPSMSSDCCQAVGGGAARGSVKAGRTRLPIGGRRLRECDACRMAGAD